MHHDDKRQSVEFDAVLRTLFDGPRDCSLAVTFGRPRRQVGGDGRAETCATTCFHVLTADLPGTHCDTPKNEVPVRAADLGEQTRCHRD